MRNVYDLDDIRDMHNIHHLHIRWRWRGLGHLLSLAIGFIAGALASGIIGNLGSQLAALLWGVLVASFTMNRWPWIIIGIVLLVLSFAVR